MRSEAALAAHIAEPSVAFVVKQKVRSSRERIRVAVSTKLPFLWSAPGIAVDVPVEVTGHEQVQAAVAVVVEERRACSPSAGGNTGFSGNVAKAAIAFVVIQCRVRETGHIDVGTSIVVEIPDCNPHAVTRPLQSRGFSDILKRSVAAIAI